MLELHIKFYNAILLDSLPTRSGGLRFQLFIHQFLRYNLFERRLDCVKKGNELLR